MYQLYKRNTPGDIAEGQKIGVYRLWNERGDEGDRSRVPPYDPTQIPLSWKLSTPTTFEMNMYEIL